MIKRTYSRYLLQPSLVDPAVILLQAGYHFEKNGGRFTDGVSIEFFMVCDCCLDIIEFPRETFITKDGLQFFNTFFMCKGPFPVEGYVTVKKLWPGRLGDANSTILINGREK